MILQAATKKAEESLKASKTEVKGLNERVKSLSGVMGKMQQGLRAAKLADGKGKATEVSLQKEITQEERNN